MVRCCTTPGCSEAQVVEGGGGGVGQDRRTMPGASKVSESHRIRSDLRTMIRAGSVYSLLSSCGCSHGRLLFAARRQIALLRQLPDERRPSRRSCLGHTASSDSVRWSDCGRLCERAREVGRREWAEQVPACLIKSCPACEVVRAPAIGVDPGRPALGCRVSSKGGWRWSRGQRPNKARTELRHAVGPPRRLTPV